LWSSAGMASKFKTLSAFNEDEFKRAHLHLASRVATMLGRKFEEGDWSYVYCHAKAIPEQGWSNVKIDIIHDGLGVEQKMLCVRSKKSMKEHCGTTLMHPAATRSIRIPSLDGDPTEIARDVLSQYADLLNQRRQKMSEEFPNTKPDLRTGWLLWQITLIEFMYFEEEMYVPNPDEYWAEWKESGGGTRKESRTLWVYENDTGKKRYSITTTAGAKIQPYFDVPPPNDPNLYYFKVQGEDIKNGLIRVWLTQTTAKLLEEKIGRLDTDELSSLILETAQKINETEDGESSKERIVKLDLARPILITSEAYNKMIESFNGVSDEHRFQLFINFLT